MILLHSAENKIRPETRFRKFFLFLRGKQDRFQALFGYDAHGRTRRQRIVSRKNGINDFHAGAERTDDIPLRIQRDPYRGAETEIQCGNSA